MEADQLARLIDRTDAEDQVDLEQFDLGDRERLRIRLLVESSRLIRDEGPEAFSLRRIAEASNTSTQMIYTLFGGKDGLSHALWEAGAELLALKCDEIPDEAPPLERLYALGRTYRQTALDDPVIYDAMFGSPMGGSGFRPPEPQAKRRTRVFRMLVECVEECIEEGVLEAEDPRHVADTFWAVAHGVIDFEIAGYYETEEEGREHFRTAHRALLRGFGAEDVTFPQPTTPTGV